MKIINQSMINIIYIILIILSILKFNPICTSLLDACDNESCLGINYARLCKNGPPCAKNAICRAPDIYRICSCRHGYEGNPYTTGCSASGCVHDHSRCKNDEMCVNSKCVKVCDHEPSCNVHSHCVASNHIKHCECSPGYRMNHNLKCVKKRFKCTSDRECMSTHACIESKCVNLCKNKQSCGENSYCTAIDHSRKCKCLSRFEYDNQNKTCVEIKDKFECSINQDCASDEVCIKKKCVNLCNHGPLCGQNMSCFAALHIRTCKCLPGFKRNLENWDCSANNSIPQCINNADCNNDESCIKGKCVKPCDHMKKCGKNAICSTINHIRSCHCPFGSIGNPYTSGCRDPVCRDNKSCRDHEVCFKNDCVSGCKASPKCGDNTICYTKKHIRICKCLPRYYGNPYDSGCKGNYKGEIYEESVRIEPK